MPTEPPPLFTDTAPEMVERYVQHLRGLSMDARWTLLGRLVEDGRALARAGLRERHPDAAPREIEIRLAALLYGRAAASILGEVPADAVVPCEALALPPG